jgi:hypothetical protein
MPEPPTGEQFSRVGQINLNADRMKLVAKAEKARAIAAANSMLLTIGQAQKNVFAALHRFEVLYAAWKRKRTTIRSVGMMQRQLVAAFAQQRAYAASEATRTVAYRAGLTTRLYSDLVAHFARRTDTGVSFTRAIASRSLTPFMRSL